MVCAAPQTHHHPLRPMDVVCVCVRVRVRVVSWLHSRPCVSPPGRAPGSFLADLSLFVSSTRGGD